MNKIVEEVRQQEAQHPAVSKSNQQPSGEEQSPGTTAAQANTSLEAVRPGLSFSWVPGWARDIDLPIDTWVIQFRLQFQFSDTIGERDAPLAMTNTGVSIGRFAWAANGEFRVKTNYYTASSADVSTTYSEDVGYRPVFDPTKGEGLLMSHGSRSTVDIARGSLTESVTAVGRVNAEITLHRLMAVLFLLSGAKAGNPNPAPSLSTP